MADAYVCWVLLKGGFSFVVWFEVSWVLLAVVQSVISHHRHHHYQQQQDKCSGSVIFAKCQSLDGRLCVYRFSNEGM